MLLLNIFNVSNRMLPLLTIHNALVGSVTPTEISYVRIPAKRPACPRHEGQLSVGNTSGVLCLPTQKAKIGVDQDGRQTKLELRETKQRGKGAGSSSCGQMTHASSAEQLCSLNDT